MIVRPVRCRRFADAAHRRFDPGLGRRSESRIDRNCPFVAVMDDTLGAGTRPQRLLRRVEDQLRVHRARYAPTNDAASEHVDHEGDVDEPGPGRDIGEVGDPQLIRTAGLELPVDAVERPGCAVIAIVVRPFRPRTTPWRVQAHGSSGARPCSGPRPDLRGQAGARPCARHRRGSSLRTRGGSPAPVDDHAAAAAATASGSASRALCTSYSDGKGD